MVASIQFVTGLLDIIEKYVPSDRIRRSIVHEICTLPTNNKSVKQTQERLWAEAQERWT